MKTDDKRIELTAWHFQLDQEDFGERDGWHRDDFDKTGWTAVQAPMAWDYYDEALWGYESPAWYYTSVPDTGIEDDKRFVLHFHGIGGSVKVWVNGVQAGGNQIRYLPFEVPLPPGFKSGSGLNIVLRVDNRPSEKKLPGTNTIEWAQYGGITHRAELIWEPGVRISGLKIDTAMQEGDGVIDISAEIANHSGRDFSGTLKLSAGGGCAEAEAVCGRGGTAELSARIIIKDALRWGLDSPNLYQLEASLSEGDALLHRAVERFGIREIRREREKLLLNGEEVFIKGFCYYDEYADYGTSVPEDVIRKELQHIKDFGANTIRLHYPQSPAYFEAADEIGLLYMPEVPINWWRPKPEDKFEDYKELAGEAEDAVGRIARLYYNHPSWAIWSMSNESNTHVPAGDKMMKTLMRQAKGVCGNRLITWVCDHRPQKGEFDDGADLISVNLYYGLHHGEHVDYTHQFEELVSKPTREYLELLAGDYPDMPVLIAEFGTVGVSGMHGNSRLTEDFQAEFIKCTWEAIVSSKNVCGATLWCWADYYHRKGFFMGGYCMNTAFGPYGVVTVDRRIKIKPYDTVKELYRAVGGS